MAATQIPRENQILKQARAEHELSLEQMAVLIGVSRQRVFQWERGEPLPPEHMEDWAADTDLPYWIRATAVRMAVAAIISRVNRIEQSANQLAQEHA